MMRPTMHTEFRYLKRSVSANHFGIRAKFLWLSKTLLRSSRIYQTKGFVVIRRPGNDKWIAKEQVLTWSQGKGCRDVIDYLASHGVRALPGRSYNTRDVLGHNWVIRQSTVNIPMQPTEVNTRNMLDGSVSLQFDQYQVATSSSPPKFNSRDEEIQSDEEELTSHIIAVLVEEERGPELLVKRIHSLAQLPVRRTPGAAGYDISITHAQDIPALGRSLLQTGICIQIPQNTYARVAPGSSAAMRGIIIMGGVIDSDYRGEVKVMAYNTTNDDIFLNKQECIAQLIIEQITSPMVREVELLGSTERGAFGFGSTTKNTASGLVFGFGNQTPQEPQVCSSNKANPFCQGCHYCCSDEEHAAGYDDYVTTYPEIQAQKGKEVDQPVKRVSGYQPLSEEQLLALQKKARQYAIEQHRYYEEEAYLNLVDAPPSMERSLAITRRRFNTPKSRSIQSFDDFAMLFLRHFSSLKRIGFQTTLIT
ncbi:hypothetical protein ZIOFF_050699 [Zingiber officinale]|uniref:dUTP diphosphatase n=1 Tax=Zingiber officinale TaxID=94328 RepID=A0A8J5FJD0_ZINOF|nr:hypothetical protein ZIOFF_050699 [Zingiber officinale]